MNNTNFEIISNITNEEIREKKRDINKYISCEKDWAVYIYNIKVEK